MFDSIKKISENTIKAVKVHCTFSFVDNNFIINFLCADKTSKIRNDCDK